ncbi:MAG: metalloregulator ArsR/SmtB family transcription factor [Coriobacteriia bacterium]|nr:metalloregulator ArsR/SmtB family transcription factor [Coriobacteriia bacterium]
MSRRSHDRSAECRAFAVDAAAVAEARDSLHDETTARSLADVFSALCDPTRLQILTALSATELCVCDLAAVTGSSQSAVSHQLRVLRDRNLVAYRRDGKRAVYRLADDHVRVLLSQALEHVAEERA